MKKLLFSTIIGLAATVTVQAQAPCSRIVTLSNDITANRTLYSDSIYRISGNVAVTAPHILTIQAGTIVEMQQNSILEILQGAQINATGTATAPIIFTPDVGAPGSRTQVSNASIIIAGRAATSLSSTTLPGGESFTTGTTAGDNSGTLQYVQIHYLNGSTTADFENALTFIGVGSGTTIDHVEVTNSGRNGLGILGGSPVINSLYTQDNFQNGILATYGTQAQITGWLENRRDPAAHSSNLSYGILIQNNLANAAATPITHVKLNNVTIKGVADCNTGPFSSDFRDGIRIANNAEAEVRNSVITGQVGNGLYLNGADCIGKTKTGEIVFSYNSLADNGNDFDAFPSSTGASWSSNSGCSTSMAAWLTGSSASCSQISNQFDQINPFDLGYDASFCGSYCDQNFTQNFVLTENTELADPDVTTSVYDFRGAVPFDNLYDWVYSCPQNAVYCTDNLLRNEAPKVNFIPNPTNGMTYAVFRTDVTGEVIISVLDKVSGMTLRSVRAKIAQSGDQKISFSMSGMEVGVYTVRIQTKGEILYGQLVVK